jgi:hypothetical protein
MKEAEISAHYWHLKTSSYGHHEAFKAFYKAMNKLADEYGEQSLGYDRSEQLEVPPMIAVAASAEEGLDLLGAHLDISIPQAHPEKQDILIRAKQEVNKLKYLLTLS